MRRTSDLDTPEPRPGSTTAGLAGSSAATMCAWPCLSAIWSRGSTASCGTSGTIWLSRTCSLLVLPSAARWGQETVGRDGWRRYRDLVRAGSADFRNEIVGLVWEGQRGEAMGCGIPAGTPAW